MRPRVLGAMLLASQACITDATYECRINEANCTSQAEDEKTAGEDTCYASSKDTADSADTGADLGECLLGVQETYNTAFAACISDYENCLERADTGEGSEKS